MNDSPTVSVSIVLFNTPADVFSRCLSSLALCDSNMTIFVIDHSAEPCVKMPLRSRFPIDYLHRPSNPGYGAGHNVGIRLGRKCGADFHLVINPDVYFDYDVISPIVEYMNAHPNTAHVMPNVLNPDGSSQNLCKFVPSPFDLVSRRFEWLPLMDHFRSDCVMVNVRLDRPAFVPYLSGCFMFLRHSCLDVVGLFDERFFLYPEDIDLTRRLAEVFSTEFFPFVAVFHEHGRASRTSKRMLLVHIWNMIKYFNKWGWLRDSKRQELNAKARAEAL